MITKGERQLGIVLIIISIIIVALGIVSIILENSSCLKENNLTYQKGFRSLECTSNNELVGCEEIYKICGNKIDDVLEVKTE